MYMYMYKYELQNYMCAAQSHHLNVQQGFEL